MERMIPKENSKGTGHKRLVSYQKQPFTVQGLG